MQVLVNLGSVISHFLEKQGTSFPCCNDMGLSSLPILLGQTGELLVSFPYPAQME